ncbi:MAG: regulatory iron-sulfur-containing complex subunit RicT [Eubacteriales bacterium]|nr:regulatory iron-sulfur-containing complex subunit RicT [Eubacteriales bacterium]
MTEVVSIKFKNRGKPYFFDPAGLELELGEHVLVDTAGGMEMGVVSRENHAVEDTAVVQPLRRVLRKATQMDLRTEDLIRQREESAMKICREKIAEHKLDMKLVDVECNFEGSKTTFFFTSDGRVDFRALVKDLAAVLHTRIELRQIGVRDEAKMLGGLGICGRPYCCSQFLDDFRPVSTKMAKVQSLSLNPAKISGSCGRLLCCLRYEQEAYEDLVKKVPKQGAFVETKDGYGTAVQVNLLRSTVKVRLDDDRDDVLHEYQANELAAVPGGRPKDGSEPPHVLVWTEPEPQAEQEAEEAADEWAIPEMIYTPQAEPDKTPDQDTAKKSGRRSHSRSRKGKAPSREGGAESVPSGKPAAAETKKEPSAERKTDGEHGNRSRSHSHRRKPSLPKADRDGRPAENSGAESARKPGGDAAAKAGKGEQKNAGEGGARPGKPRRRHSRGKKGGSKPAENP